MHPDTLTATSRWFVPPKVRQTTERIGTKVFHRRSTVF
jgi:hypothetical protein